MPRGRPKKVVVEKEETAGIARTDSEDDLTFLDSRSPDKVDDYLSASARAKRSKQKPGDVVFFSRFKQDEVLLESSIPIQVGANKWSMQPPQWIRFLDRVYTTNDPKIIEYLRNHDRYGIEILEFGKPEHESRIKLYDDSGRKKHLNKLHRLGRASEQRWEQGIDDG